MVAFQGHPSDEAIELYALGRLPEELFAPVEEHLLVCDQCQDTLRREDEFVQSLRAALNPNSASGKRSL
jgi:anti-sigma factor RsiW